MKKLTFTAFVLLACFTGYGQTFSLQLNPSTYNGGYNIPCHSSSNGSIDLIVIGGTAPFAYQWSNTATTQNLTGLIAGSYTVTVTDANSNSVTDSLQLLQPALLQAGVEKEDVSYYGGNNGEVVTAISGGTPPYTYLWSNGSTATDIKDLVAGNYTVTVTDMNNCTATGSATVTQPAQLVITSLNSPLINGYNVSCYKAEDGSISVTAAGGVAPYSYEWSSGATTNAISNAKAGEYYIKVTDQKNIQVTGYITLTEPEVLSAQLLPSLFILGDDKYNISCYNCHNGTITNDVTGGTPPYTYDWDNTTTTQHQTALGPGKYKVTVTDAAGCETAASTDLTQPDRDDWAMQGNTGTDPVTNYMGTADSTDFVFKTNGIDRARLKANGDFLINRIITNRIVSPDSIIYMGDSTLVYGSNKIYTDNKGLVLGFNNTSIAAQGTNSISIGTNSKTAADATNSIAIGHRVCAGAVGTNATDAIVIGSGYGANIASYFRNEVPNSLMIGFNSDEPTVFVTPSNGAGTTGTVGIGTTYIPSGYKLAVKGDIIAEKVTIQLRSNWPDYVFKKNYNLLSLTEFEKFISEHNHLPGIPAAGEMKKEGLDVGDTQAKQMEKIEEMALYIIQLNKKIEVQDKRIEQLEKQKANNKP